MLAEAVDVMRQLWTGDTVDHWGEYYTVENARVVHGTGGTDPGDLGGVGRRVGGRRRRAR